MANFETILAAYQAAKAEHTKMALCTVVHVTGSAYRQAGARMLTFANGRSIGSISGGCLEKDVIIHAQSSIETTLPQLLQYSTGSDDEIIFGIGAGCNGSVEILVEPLGVPGGIDILQFLSDCHRNRTPAVLGILVNSNDTPASRCGTIVAACGDAELRAGHISESLIDQALAKARLVLNSGRSSLITINYCASCGCGSGFASPSGSTTGAHSSSNFACCSSTDYRQATLFFDYFQPPIQLLIFGAGSDVAPVAAIAQQLGWSQQLLDPKRFATPDNASIPTEEIVIETALSGDKHLTIDQRTAILIMSHNYWHDLQGLKRFLPSNAGYIGLLGPKHRTSRLLQEVRTEGLTLKAAQDQRVYAPVGLEIGAETEEEIALSVVAEIQAVMCSRPAGFLRDKKGSIHDWRTPVDDMIAHALTASGAIELSLCQSE